MRKDIELHSIRLKKLWVFIFLFFLFAFIYLWEHSTIVALTFKYYEENKKLKALNERVEALRVKLVGLSAAQRIYEITE